MNTSRFTIPDDGFPLLDLTAKFAFKTSSGVSFIQMGVTAFPLYAAMIPSATRSRWGYNLSVSC